MEIDIYTTKCGRNYTNCYTLIEEKQALVIDPGSPAEVDDILEIIANQGAKLELIVNTHSHYDHIGGNQKLLAKTSAKLAAHAEAVDLLPDPGKNLSKFMGEEYKSPTPDVILQAGEELKLENLAFNILHLPGHSPDSLALYLASEKLLFSGDLIFARGIGRADLPGGDRKLLNKSINRVLQDLPLETEVYPGHGEKTTLDKFKKDVYSRLN